MAEIPGQLNLYAYCNNNPVMYTDPTGNFFSWLAALLISLSTPVNGIGLQLAVSVVSYAGIAIASLFNEDIRNDMNNIGWNPFNRDESLVGNSTKVSFYKGVPVFRTSGSSGSFGVILLTRGGFKGSSGHFWTSKDILKHEWGHSIQQMIIGPVPYLMNIGIPSAFIDNNDNAPWEITADRFGGVNRKYNPEDIKRGWNYFWWGKIYWAIFMAVKNGGVMKKLLYSIILFVLVFTTGCHTALERKKEEMLKIYCNDESYITVVGEIVKKDNNMFLTIKSEDLKSYIKNEDGIYNYLVFSESMPDVNVGDVIKYTTVKVQFKNMEWLPIIEIIKNDEKILDYQIGKKNLIDWVNQLQVK